MTVLAGFDKEHFLDHYWQQRPLLLPAALPDFSSPLTAEELAGLALESGVESGVEARIVRGSETDWQLDPGPFDAASFAATTPWTLLVQAVDQIVPEVAELRSVIDFLPSWRFDDIMVSYANDGGGVGPHYDNYDVFLLQGAGQRRWRIGQQCEPNAALRPTPGLRILADFEQSDEYLLQAGDILYLPPRIAHWGIAVGNDCMTYSLGLRAPRINDLLSRWLDGLLERIDPELFYQDPALQPAARCGEIEQSVLANARQQLLSAIEDADSEQTWFGELVSEPRYALDPAPAATGLPEQVKLDPAARLAWCEQRNRLLVFANGQSLEAASEHQALLQRLCAGDCLAREELAQTELDLLQQLQELGCLDYE